MLKQLKLSFEKPVGKTPNYFWAYNMYSSLLEKIDDQYINHLHEKGLKPISQYLVFPKRKEIFSWRINLIGKESMQHFLPVLQNVASYYIDNHKTELTPLEKKVEKTFTEKTFIKKYLVDDPFSNMITISIQTPCSFKSKEEYIIYPSIELIVKSAIQKWNSFAEELIIEDEKTIFRLMDAARIVSYKLESFKYHVKSVRIPSFLGEITLSVRGCEETVRLFNMLMNYLEFSGMGIKSALGMGGVLINNNTRSM